MVHGTSDIKLLTLLGCNRQVPCCSLRLKTDFFYYFMYFHRPSKQIPVFYTNLATIHSFHNLSSSFFNIVQICNDSRDLLMSVFH